MKHTGTVDYNCTEILKNQVVLTLSFFSFFVQENELEGFVVGEVFAEDIDSGTYGEVVYSISGPGSEKYVVND